MDQQTIRTLIDKFNSNEISQQELELLETLIADGKISPDAFERFESTRSMLDQTLAEISEPVWTDRFYQMLEEVRSVPLQSPAEPRSRWMLFPAKYAAVAALIFGIGLGWLGRHTIPTSSSSELHTEVTALKETLMLAMLDDEAVADRLMAVNYSQQVPNPSESVITALMNTLKSDKSVNVRLAAVDALAQYQSNPEVREVLVSTMAEDRSPLVQLRIAESIIRLQEAESQTVLDALQNRNDIDAEIQRQLSESIKQLQI